MTLNRTTPMVSLLALLALVASGVIAGEKHDHEHGHGHDEDKRQHGAHVHGIAALNLALEGDELHVELDSPAANIVGFEHVPSSAADHAALDKAVAMLRDADQLFRFNSAAGCQMEKVMVTSALLDEDHNGHRHEDHAHEAHGHDEHGHEAHGDEHGHEEHRGDSHSDIDAVYHFECDQPTRLQQLTVELFDAFPGMEKLDVQYIIENKQGAAALTSANRVLRF
jgi:hypothetical protein